MLMQLTLSSISEVFSFVGSLILSKNVNLRAMPRYQNIDFSRNRTWHVQQTRIRDKNKQQHLVPNCDFRCERSVNMPHSAKSQSTSFLCSP